MRACALQPATTTTLLTRPLHVHLLSYNATQDKQENSSEEGWESKVSYTITFMVQFKNVQLDYISTQAISYNCGNHP